MTVDLSVVLPCFRAATLAERSVARLTDYLAGTGLTYEVIVVDDGGGDFPSGVWVGTENVRLLRFANNRGKGAAVGAGMLAAQGGVRTYTDVDLPYDLDLLPVMVELIRTRGFHLVIGDRTLPGATYRAELGASRRFASAIFSQFVGHVVTGGFFDTQCGLKALRGDVAEALFALRRLDRFAFDVELVYMALKHRLDIKRVPVKLRHNETSSVRLLRDSAQGIADVLRIKLFQLGGAYDSEAVEEIVRHDFSQLYTHAGHSPPSLADDGAPRRPITGTSPVGSSAS